MLGWVVVRDVKMDHIVLILKYLLIQEERWDTQSRKWYKVQEEPIHLFICY